MSRHILLFITILSAATATVGAEDTGDRDAVLLFNTASRFYRQKNWKDAAATFGDFLKKYPRHKDASEARFAAGYCLNRLGDHAGAVETLRVSAKEETTAWAADANFYLARSIEALALDPKAEPEERKRRFTAAAESFGKAAQHYARMSTAAQAPDTKEKDAEKAAAAAKRHRDFRVLALGAQGESLYQAELFPESTAALDVLLAEAALLGDSPYYQRGVYVLGLARQAVARRNPAAPGRFGSSRQALAAAADPRFETEPLWEEAAYLLARLAHQDGDLAPAAETYLRVVKKAGGRAPEAAYYRALALYESQTPELVAKARDELARFLADHAKHSLAPRARFYEALAAFDLKDNTAAAALFQVVAAESPEFAGRAHLRRAQALLLEEAPDAAAALEAAGKAVEALEKDAAEPQPDPLAQSRLAEAYYWKGEAALTAGGKELPQAAEAFEQVASRFASQSADLAEKALYQKARALSLAGRPADAASAAERYWKTYPTNEARYRAESLLLAAECAFHSKAGEVTEALRRDAPRLYREARAVLKDPTEATRAFYMEGVSLYFLGEYKAAAEVLGAFHSEASKTPATLEAYPETTFYLADSLAQEARAPVSTSEERERWKRAVSLYQSYLGKSRDGSHIPSAMVNLGLCQEWLEDSAGARKSFEDFLTAFPTHELANQVRFELANVRLVLGDAPGAAAAYAAAAEGKGADALLAAKALYQKGMIERRDKLAAKAAETLETLVSRHAGAIEGEEAGATLLHDAKFQRALALLEAGKADEGRTALEEHLAAYPGGPQEAEARNQLARSLLDASRAEDALEALEPVLGGDPARVGRDQALYLAAWAHSALAFKSPERVGEASEALTPEAEAHRDQMEAAYRKLLSEHPQSALTLDAMLELGQYLFNRKAYAESKKWLAQVREAVESDTGPVRPESEAHLRDVLERSLFGLGFIAYEEREYPEAGKLLDRVTANATSPLAPRALFQAARAYMLDGSTAEAAKRFQTAADAPADRLGALHEECLLRLSECYHQLQKYPEAQKSAERLLAEYPQGGLRAEGLFAKGFAEQFAGKLEEAIQSYRQVVAASRSPVAARAQYHIGECRLEQKKHREAALEFSTTVANFDFGGEFESWIRKSLLAAGLAYAEGGDPAAASTQFRELVERFPQSEEAKAAERRIAEAKTSAPVPVPAPVPDSVPAPTPDSAPVPIPAPVPVPGESPASKGRN